MPFKRYIPHTIMPTTGIARSQSSLISALFLANYLKIIIFDVKDANGPNTDFRKDKDDSRCLSAGGGGLY